MIVKKLILGICVVAANFAAVVNAQPSDIIRDGFSDEASDWLKKHPDVEKCTARMVKDFKKQNPSQGLSSDVFGEYIGICGKKSRPGVISANKMMGDVVDKNKNANPKNTAEAKNKKNGKDWQDENGYIHFPDGSASSRPID